MDSAPGVRKILWRREWHTGKNGQIVGVFVLHRNTCQKVPTVKKRKERERKTYTSGGGMVDRVTWLGFISLFSQSPLRRSDWATEHTGGRDQIYANTH